MLGGLEALPVLLLQIAADLALIVVAATVVRRAHQRAGLALLATAGLSALTGLLAPIASLAMMGGLVWFDNGSGGSSNGEAMVVLAIVAMAIASWSPYVTRALEIGAVCYALVQLVRRLPAEARDDRGR